MRDLPVLKIDLNKPETFGNLAEKLDANERRTLATDLIELIGIDEGTMSDWLTRADRYLQEIKGGGDEYSSQTAEDRGSEDEAPPSTELTLTAIIQFAARATDALLGEPDLARSSEPGGENLAAWVSSQLRTKDPHWLLDTDPLVVHMSATGLAWRKRSFDRKDKQFNSNFLPCKNVIFNSNARSVERMPRITEDFERYPYEVERAIRRGHWIDYEPRYDDNDPQAPKKFYECHTWLDLDGDEIDEPWAITISRDDVPEVIKIEPRWSKKTIVNTDEALIFNPIVHFYPYIFLPDVDGGFLPIGFGELLHRVQGSADRLLATITETAKNAAEDGGILAGSQFSVPEKLELQANRINVVPTDGRPLQDAFSAFPTKQVSPASVQIFEKMLTLGDRLAGTLNTLENAPASMSATMAKGLIDTGSQVQSAVHRRMVASLTQEMRNFVLMADAYDMLPTGISAQDGNGVAVTADPQLATEMARSALAGIYMELLKDPLTDWKEVRLRLYRTLRLPDPEKLLGQPQSPQATPYEKMEGVVKLLKQRTENIKVTGQVAVQLTQALLNMVQAAGGMQQNQQALLVMAQLEHAVQNMMQEAGSAGTDVNGMVAQQGNPTSATLPSQTPANDSTAVLGGTTGGPDTSGSSVGVQ